MNKKIFSFILVILATLFVGIMSTKAVVKNCVYKGTWRSGMYRHEGVTFTVTIPLDLDKKDGSGVEIVYTTEKESIGLAVWNVYRVAGLNTFSNYYGIDTGNSGKYNDMLSYYLSTKSCPSKLTIFNNYSQGQGYAALPNNGHYDDPYKYEILADLEVQNQSHSENEKSLQCGYATTIEGTRYEISIMYGNEPLPSAGLNILDPTNYNADKCHEQLYACISTYEIQGYRAMYVSKERDTMFAKGGIFKREFGVEAEDSCESGDYEYCLSQDGIYCNYISTSSVEQQFASSGCEKIDVLLEKYGTANASMRSEYKEEITNFCSYYLSEMSYSSGSCMKTCLNLHKMYPNIFDNKIERKCGFSLKLVAWIQNIMRWIKYIVPVILIILTILEFIGAMTGDKEDEMTKAKKHFIIRLIAVVLIFLTPMLVDFIINKMGINAVGCSLF